MFQEIHGVGSVKGFLEGVTDTQLLKNRKSVCAQHGCRANSQHPESRLQPDSSVPVLNVIPLPPLPTRPLPGAKILEARKPVPGCSYQQHSKGLEFALNFLTKIRKDFYGNFVVSARHALCGTWTFQDVEGSPECCIPLKIFHSGEAEAKLPRKEIPDNFRTDKFMKSGGRDKTGQMGRWAPG